MSRLALYFLGTPRIELDSEMAALSHHKALALLAYLAVTRQPHTRQALAALLWPDYDPANARHEMRRMLWVLNKSLGQGWLEVDRQTVLLPVQPELWLDVARFRELLVLGQRHGHPVSEVCGACLEPLTEAVALVRGDFLAGFTLADSPDFDTWQTFETESLRRELAGALERLVQLLLQQRETLSEETISYTRRWLALDPLHEPAHRQLMQLYFWAGQPAAALRQYQTCVRLLKEELDILPSAETTALMEAIKANRVSPPPVTLKQQPVTVIASPAPPTPSPGPPHNLPLQATPFIGREAVLDDLQQHLSDPEVRLMTIVGPGGIGKTRLALTLAERYLRPLTNFTDGIYFISLAPIGSAEAIVQTIAEGLGFPLATAQEPATQLLTYLRHKRMLLVLDNFEHVLTGAELVSQILQTATAVKVVVTSRERLNLVNETLWPIGGLNFAKLTGVEAALTYEAVQLFMQRARRVRPDFTLRVEDLPHLERILQDVWGMPLAIELAAGWLNMLSVAEVAAELGHSLDLLKGELRDVPDRHRSMQLVFDHSWERLEAEEQALFKSLSVFRGGFNREAARQVTGASLQLLAGLVNKSLLTSQPDTGRYELHELLRQYAEMQLAADDLEASLLARQTHATYYADFMQRRWPDLHNSKQISAVVAIEQDIENIRVAWHYRLAEKNSSELLKFMSSFHIVYDIRGWYQAGIALFEEAAEQLCLVSGDAAALVRGKALGYAGFYTGIIGKPERGLALSNEAVALIHPLHQPEALLYALYCNALNHLYRGDFEQAIVVAHEFGRLGQTIGDHWGQAASLNFMAMALIHQHKLAEAQEKSDRALQIFTQEIGDYFGLTWAALLRGLVALGQGAYAEAKPFYERSLTAAQALNYRRPIQQSYNNLGDASFYLGEIDQAERYFRLSLEISDDMGQTRETLGTLYDLAKVWAAQSKKVKAVELLAVVLHHPLSNLPLFLRTESTLIKEAAERLRVRLAADLEPQTYQTAWTWGQATQLETVVMGLLREELGISPSAETTALYEAIKANRLPPPQAVISENTTTETQNLSQNPKTGRETEGSDLQPKHNLPAQLTPLIGRQQEVAAVRRLFTQEIPQVRLVTLTGPGGTGKTRLSLQVAAELLGHFADGVFFVPLASLSDPQLLVSAIARQLDVREGGSQPVLQILQSALQEKHLLLVLDNFEQIVTAAPIIAELLAVAPRLKVLVTSRALLQLRGEYEFLVPPLGLPDLSQNWSLERLRQCEAIQLFIERAQMTPTGFTLTPENAPTVSEICHRLDGLPLAIELAAARIKLLSPQTLLTRLGSRLKILTGGAQDMPARQQTLRNTIDWSYSLLDQAEQTLFSRLAVFVGGFTLETAEAICTADNSPLDILEGVTSLLNKSLLVQQDSSGSQSRFRMLETIREYALERLAENGQLEALQQQHARYFAAQIDQIRKNLNFYTGDWLDWAEEEYNNLQATLTWSQVRPAEVELGLRMVGVLYWFWYRRGYFSEGRAWCQGFRALSSEKRRTGDRVSFLVGSGTMALIHGDLVEAGQQLQEGIAIAREVEDERWLMASLTSWGILARYQGDTVTAQRTFEETLAIGKRLNLWWFIINSLLNLGNVAVAHGDFSTARDQLEQAADMAKTNDDTWLMANILNNLGEVARIQGDYEQAQRSYEESQTLFRKIDAKADVARSLHSLGYVAQHQGDYEQAEAHFRESLSMFQELGNRRGMVECLAGLAGLVATQGQPQRAARLLVAAESQFRASGASWWPADQVEVERNLAVIQAALDPETLAAAWVQGRAMSLAEAIAEASSGL